MKYQYAETWQFTYEVEAPDKETADNLADQQKPFVAKPGVYTEFIGYATVGLGTADSPGVEEMAAWFAEQEQ